MCTLQRIHKFGFIIFLTTFHQSYQKDFTPILKDTSWRLGNWDFFSISFLFSQFHGPPEKRVYELYMGLLMSDRLVNIRNIHILLSRSYLDFIQILSKFYPDFIRVLFRFSSDFMPIHPQLSRSSKIRDPNEEEEDPRPRGFCLILLHHSPGNKIFNSSYSSFPRNSKSDSSYSS